MSASFSSGWWKASSSSGGHTFYHLFRPMHTVQVLDARDSSQQHVHVQRGEKQTINNTAHRSLYHTRQSAMQIRVHQRASNRLQGIGNAGLPLTSHTSDCILSKWHVENSINLACLVCGDGCEWMNGWMVATRGCARDGVRFAAERECVAALAAGLARESGSRIDFRLVIFGDRDWLLRKT